MWIVSDTIFSFVTYTNFCGSYGEEGWEIIMNTLRQRFPTPFLEDSSGLVPANWMRVIEFVLLPEVTYRLVSEDLGISIEEAVGVVIESESFGKYAHPSDNARERS